MASTIEFECAIKDSDHILEVPIQLSCGHAICKGCIPTDEKDDLNCGKCGILNLCDLKGKSEAREIKIRLIVNFPAIYENSSEKLKSLISSQKDEIHKTLKNLKTDSECSKDRISVRIDGLKDHLDYIKVELMQEVDDYERELRRQLNHFNFIDKYEQAFKEMRTDIQGHRFFSESFYEYQKAVKELSQNLKKLRSIRHQITFESDEKGIPSDLVGIVNTNFDGIQQLINQGKKEIHDLKYEPYDFCVCSNGNIITADYRDCSVSVYSEDFVLVKHIRQIRTLQGMQDIKPRCVATNNKALDLRFYIGTSGQIICTDSQFNYLNKYCTNSKIPRSMVFHEEFLYYCENETKLITILDSNLKLKNYFFIEIEPWEIQIFFNLICVVSYDSVSDFIGKELHLYDIKTQTRQYNFDIDMHGWKFYSSFVFENKLFVLNKETKKENMQIVMYNKTVSRIGLVNLHEKFDGSHCLIRMTNKRVFLYLRKNQIISLN